MNVCHYTAFNIFHSPTWRYLFVSLHTPRVFIKCCLALLSIYKYIFTLQYSLLVSRGIWGGGRGEVGYGDGGMLTWRKVVNSSDVNFNHDITRKYIFFCQITDPILRPYNSSSIKFKPRVQEKQTLLFE